MSACPSGRSESRESRSQYWKTLIDPHVIVLEDDHELRSLLTRGLREEGFEVSTAGTASELLELHAAGEPDAMIVDVGLPDADGRDLVQALRVQGARRPSSS